MNDCNIPSEKRSDNVMFDSVVHDHDSFFSFFVNDRLRNAHLSDEISFIRIFKFKFIFVVNNFAKHDAFFSQSLC